MLRFIKVILLSLVMLIPMGAQAQDAKKVFKEGMALMQKARAEKKSKDNCKKNANAAIKKFAAAKVLSPSMKAECDEQIGYANIIIANPYPRSGGEPAPVAKRDSLNVHADVIELDYLCSEPKVITVGSSRPGWKVSTKTEDTSWCEITKNEDDKTFSVKCTPWGATYERKTVVAVTNGAMTREVPVVQKGMPVNLTVTMGKKQILGIAIPSKQEMLNNTKNIKESDDVTILELKKKGDSKDLEIVCNSDSTYDNDCNWYIAQRPNWCDIQMNTSKNEKFKANEFKNDSRTKTRSAKVVVKTVPKDDSNAAHLGRIGDLIIKSQDKEVRIRLVQNK